MGSSADRPASRHGLSLSFTVRFFLLLLLQAQITNGSSSLKPEGFLLCSLQTCVTAAAASDFHDFYCCRLLLPHSPDCEFHETGVFDPWSRGRLNQQRKAQLQPALGGPRAAGSRHTLRLGSRVGPAYAHSTRGCCPAGCICCTLGSTRPAGTNHLLPPSHHSCPRVTRMPARPQCDLPGPQAPRSPLFLSSL